MSNINYRKDQIPIINYTDGSMAVPAVPGAGKTFIMTNLVAKLLLENKNQKGKILVLTYMNSAANNFKGRIKKILEEKGVQNLNGLEVMTIHSLAVKIIKEKPEVMMLSDEFNIADDLQKNIILNECINNFRDSGGEKAFRYFLKEQKDPNWQQIQLDAWTNGFFELVSSTISSLKYNDISPAKLDESPHSKKGILKIISFIYRQYDKSLKRNGLLDYDDLLIYAYKTLCADEALKLKLQNKYTYIFEDECQDSNEIQGKIIKMLCENNNNLVRVGDVNQSITGTFSSSDPKFFKSFMEDADCCYEMNMSNRSSKDILDLANSLVDYVCDNLKQIECREALTKIEIEPVEKGQGYKENPKPDKYQINYKWYETFEDEVKKTAANAAYIKKNFKDKSIGILVPFNSQLSAVGKELEALNLEYEELGPNSKSKRRVINNLAKIIDFVVNCDDIEKLIDVLFEVFIKDENDEYTEDVKNLLRNYEVEEVLYGGLSEISSKIDENWPMKQSLIEGLHKLTDIIDYKLVRIDKFILFIKDKMELENEEISLVEYISFYIRYLTNENPNITLEEILDILADSSNKVFNHIIDIVYEINGYEPEPGSITVCNYHKSKGMEWDCVFLLQLTEFNFPDNITQKFQCDKWYLKEQYKNTEAIVKEKIELLVNNRVSQNYLQTTKLDIIKEKIRVLYVGITRAKEMLIMSGSDYKSKDDTKIKNRRQNRCLYLRVLQAKIDEKRKVIR